MRISIPLLSVIPFAVLCLLGCRGEGEPDDGRLHIVATTGMIADAARVIGRDHVRVEALMGPGVDPHLYGASRTDQKRLHECDLVLFHGHHLEGKMADYLSDLRAQPRDGQEVVAVGEAVAAAELFRSEALASYPDPHIWFDLRLWKRVTVAIRDALIARDAARATDYSAAAAAYLAEIDSTHAWALARVAKLDAARRRIVTSHDAYRYFADAYGFKVRGLQGISTATEPGLKNIRSAVTYIKTYGIPVIFAETSFRRDAVEQVATEAGCRVCETELYSDALGESGSGAGTFLGMFRHNVTTIVDALSKRTGESP